MQFPRLFCLSTVCLLKHYNQDYPLHYLRTDFTGPNGVGKSIIADLFQIVFIADTRYIKFATEGIDSKKRKIEKLPFQSGVGYAFFQVEVAKGRFIILGSAILAQGNTHVKPFAITSNIDFESGAIDENCFDYDKLLLSKHFLKKNGEPFALDELASELSSKYDLYLHYFNTKEERSHYHTWLYKNQLLPISLVKESNLKAYAKVIQSFSKSKFLDIDNSHSLTEYLFEENEQEIETDFRQQEQAVNELLYQFRSTKENINLLQNKQVELIKLNGLDSIRLDAQHRLYTSDFLVSQQKMLEKQKALTKTNSEIELKQKRLETLRERTGKFSSIVEIAKARANKISNAYDKLAKSTKIFESIDKLQSELEVLQMTQTAGLINDGRDNNSQELLKRDAHYFSETIKKWQSVLSRYRNIEEIKSKKSKQDSWIKTCIRKLDESESSLVDLRKVLNSADENSLFVKALLERNGKLTDKQKAVLIHLTDVSLRKPSQPRHKSRYANSLDILHEQNIEMDMNGGGWWLKIGELNEFVSRDSLILKGLPQINGNDLKELQIAVSKEIELLEEQRVVYDNLSKGVEHKSISREEFDTDLSDHTKVTQIELAIDLCGLLPRKVSSLNSLYQQQIEALTAIKNEFEIRSDELDFEVLINKLGARREHLTKRKDKISEKFNEEQSEINNLTLTIPNLQGNLNRLRTEYVEETAKFTDAERKFNETYPGQAFPFMSAESFEGIDLQKLESEFKTAAENYLVAYSQIVGQFEETKMQRDIRINEQIDNKTYSFQILEEALLGKKIKALDRVTPYLEELNVELLNIADELLRSITKVFGKTEKYFDNYRIMIQSLNSFFKGHLISNRFYFRINFLTNPKLDIKWIEQLRKSAHTLVNSSNPEVDLTPEQFVERFYIQQSGSKVRVPIQDLLNPKRYFNLKGELTDEKNNDVPGSTGESYTAISLLGIARLSIVQDGDRPGLRFIILEESATLDNVNFALFPQVAQKYGYQIVTMTPKPYSIGGDEGWFIHHLLPGKENPDVNYPKVISYFRTVNSKEDLDTHLKVKNL